MQGNGGPVSVLRGQGPSLFLQDDLDRLQTHATNLVVPVTHTKQLLAILSHEPLGSLLSRFQVGLRLHVPEHKHHRV